MAEKEKTELRRRFSADPDRYYKVELFEREGFTRRRCRGCGRYFWSLEERDLCPEYPCSTYTFLGNPPTKLRVGYTEAWKLIESFFVKHGHTSVKRYPVVCRWRPDLYFTVASVVNFQRIEGGKVVFELPANPLIVPQMCLRFNDIPSVGVTGRHYTSFCMIGQHSISDDKGYWKDRCIDLDFDLLIKVFGIPKEEVVFLEDVWLGYGAFGYSLEYHVRGLELGNAVFTEFLGEPGDEVLMKEKVVDMGAGLERFSWLTTGRATSYDTTFDYALPKLLDLCKLTYDEDTLITYYRRSCALDYGEGVAPCRLDDEFEALKKRVEPIEALYALLDHTRTLTFAIADGGLPSNVAGGYNLRVLLRRALSILERYKFDLSLSELTDMHISGLAGIYPELKEHKDEIKTILSVEEHKYLKAKERVAKIIEKLKREAPPSEDKLITLYESDGIQPEELVKHGIILSVPLDFYKKVTEKHLGVKEAQQEKVKLDVSNIQPTQLLFYKDEKTLQFKAKVLKIFDGGYVVLDQTAFYPRSGGQEPDLGTIGASKVVDVEKYGYVVVHKIHKPTFKEGEVIECLVDGERRAKLTRHHTATHIINGAARRLLGNWVWQHSAYKDVDRARLDITHFEHLSEEQLKHIEILANKVVQSNQPIAKETLPRGEAESKYGFRIYQGGVVPGKEVRIVNILDWDVEACGGTHCDSTGEVGYIKILKSERIQDGVERLEFAAGIPAVEYAQKIESIVKEVAKTVSAQEDKVVQVVEELKRGLDDTKRVKRALAKKLVNLELSRIVEDAKPVKNIIVKFNDEAGLDEEYHILFGEAAIALQPALVYVGVVIVNDKAKIIVFSGSDAVKAGVKAGALAKALSALIGGSGGGDVRFAQGGGSADNVKEVASRVLEIIADMVG
ncbi:MAG: alanine--tRNA ligase [Nitrososphaerales archaeon]